MFFILSKILSIFLKPLFLISLSFLIAYLLRNKNIRKAFLIIGTILFIFFTNGFIANELQLAWEIPAIPIKQLEEYEAGIVLTGITDSKKTPRDRVYFHSGPDRVLHTVQLYRMKKIKKIIISGGSGLLINTNTKTEAEELKGVFLLCGIPEDAIITESKSKNTRENAQFTKDAINANNIRGKTLLITSAFHMRRASACFNKAGLASDLFPVDFYSHERSYAFDTLFIPSETAVGVWVLLIHEIFGFIVYKLAGYC